MRALTTFLLLSAFAIGQNVPDRTAILRHGESLVATNQLAAAEGLYENALRDFPDDAELRYELGMIFFRQQKWTKAIEIFRKSASEQPGEVKPLFYLAQSYFMTSDLDRARQTMAQAAVIAPKDAQVCQKYGEYLSATLDNRKEGLAWLKKARNLNTGLPRIDFEVGKTEFEITDYINATLSLEQALKKNPNDGEAAFYLGEAQSSLNDWARAREYYSYALARKYVRSEAYYGLGRADVALAEYTAAVDPLNQAIAMQPSLINAHLQLAKAYRRLGRTAQAEKENRLFAAMTDRVDTSRRLSTSEERAWKEVKPLLEANKEEEALQLLAKMPVAEAHGPGGALYLLGVMYYSMGRNDDAKRVLALAQKAAPDSANIAAYLGMVQLSSEEASAAENSFQSALALDSNEALALIGLGGLRYQQKRWADSVRYLERSRTADPRTLFILCDAYYRDGRPEQAELTAEVIRAFGTDNKPLLGELDRLIASHHHNLSKAEP